MSTLHSFDDLERQGPLAALGRAIWRALGTLRAIPRAVLRLLDFRGRASRREYLGFFLGSILIAVLLGALDVMLFGPSSVKGVGPLSGSFMALTLVPYLSVSVRRLHDVGRSGWWILFVQVVPFVGLLLQLVLLFMRGKPESDRLSA